MESHSSTHEAIPAGQARGRATRADIITIAKRLFSEHGYHQTGLSDIQAATGLTKGAFYHHFRSKEVLALAVLESARCDYAERLIGPAQSLPSPAERLTALLEGILRLNADPQWQNCEMLATLCAELTSETGRLRDAVQQMQLHMLTLWRELISSAQDEGQIDDRLDPVLWAQWIQHTFMGLLLARKLGTIQSPAERVVAHLKQMLFARNSNGVEPPTGRQGRRRNSERKNSA